MKKYKYQQDLSVLNENAMVEKTMRSTICIDTINVNERIVIDTLEDYGKRFLVMADSEIFGKAENGGLSGVSGTERGDV